jgi:hypothetical protein
MSERGPNVSIEAAVIMAPPHATMPTHHNAPTVASR